MTTLKFTCPQCLKEYEVYASQHKRVASKHCSYQCRYAALRARNTAPEVRARAAAIEVQYHNSKALYLRNKDRFAIVDAKDYDFLNQFSWHVTKGGSIEKAENWRDGKYKRGFMGRMILGITGRTRVFHLNGNPLDNRRENLKVGKGRVQKAKHGGQEASTSTHGTCRIARFGSDDKDSNGEFGSEPPTIHRTDSLDKVA